MYKPLSFARLDLRLIKPYVKSLGMMMAIGLAISIGSKSSGLLSTYMMVAMMMLLSYPFAISEKNGLDTLYGTLSLSRKHIVLGRYLFVLLLAALFAVFSVLGSFLLSRVVGTEFLILETFGTAYVLFSLICLIVAFQYPLYFKVSYTKVRYLVLLPLMLIFFLAQYAPNIMEWLGIPFSWGETLESIAKMPVLYYALPLVISQLAFWLSCSCSRRIYEKKDL